MALQLLGVVGGRDCNEVASRSWYGLMEPGGSESSDIAWLIQRRGKPQRLEACVGRWQYKKG